MAESHDLLRYLIDAEPPAKFLDDIHTTNPAFTTWKKNDVLLYGWILGTMTEEALCLVIGLGRSSKVWLALKDSYTQSSQDTEFYMQQQLSHMRKDDGISLNDYLCHFKNICDSLAAIGKPVPNRSKVFALLNGLGERYDNFVTAKLRPPSLSYSEIIPLLQSFETRLVSRQEQPHVAFYGQKNGASPSKVGSKNQSFNSKGKGFSQHGQISQSPSTRPIHILKETLNSIQM